MRTDICKENLTVKKIDLVFRNTISNARKPYKVSERHSDAFVYVLSGHCRYVFDGGGEFTARVGDVFYLPYKSVYTMHISREDYKFIYCDFEFQGDVREPCLFAGEQVSAADSLFSRLYTLYRSNPVGNYVECMSVLYSIYSAVRHASEHTSHGGDSLAIIAYARQRMEESFSDPSLGITELYERGSISDVYFRKLFKEEYGVSPVRYLMTVRLKNAKKLMGYPFFTLEECAKKSGFSSLQYFGRVFKEEFGITPGQYRKKYNTK